MEEGIKLVIVTSFNSMFIYILLIYIIPCFMFQRAGLRGTLLMYFGI